MSRIEINGVYKHAPLTDAQIAGNKRNLDREIIIKREVIDVRTALNSAVTAPDDVGSTPGDANAYPTSYIFALDYDSTDDSGTNSNIRRYIPTLELLGSKGSADDNGGVQGTAGSSWINIETTPVTSYNYLSGGETLQDALEILDASASAAVLQHLIDGTDTGSLLSSNDGSTSTNAISSTQYAVVLGTNNTITDVINSSILNGRNNNIEKVTGTIGTKGSSSIVSGEYNRIKIHLDQDSGSCFIGSGSNNYIDNSPQSAILGGQSNFIYSSSPTRNNSILSGGGNNVVNSSYSTVLTGYNNYVRTASLYSAILSGDSNVVDDSDECVIGGGYRNYIINGNECGILSGSSNYVYSNQSCIVGGSNNRIETDVNGSSISGGYRNYITTGLYCFIGGGQNNTINASNDNSIITGYNNTIGGGTRNSIISGNGNELIDFASDRSIINGYQNKILSSYSALIGAGNSGTINNSSRSVLTGGNSNYIKNSNDSFIGSGQSNYILDTALVTDTNTTSIQYNAIVSGDGNKIYNNPGTRNFIGAGYQNYIFNNPDPTLEYSASCVVGGRENRIYGDSIYSIIGGGRDNLVAGSAYGFVGGGYINELKGNAPNSLIVGGQSNYILNSTHASILGGNNNKIQSTSTYSSILGGNANIISGHTDCFIVGSGIVADRSNALFTESLTLTNRSLDLDTKTPSVGDTLIVESTFGDVGILKWSKDLTTNSITSASNSGGTYFLYGESIVADGSTGTDNFSSDNYITLNTTDLDSSTSQPIPLGLSIDGYSNGTINFSSIHTNVQSYDGIPVEEGSYSLEISTVARWTGDYLNSNYSNSNIPTFSTITHSALLNIYDVSGTLNYSVDIGSITPDVYKKSYTIAGDTSTGDCQVSFNNTTNELFIVQDVFMTNRFIEIKSYTWSWDGTNTTFDGWDATSYPISVGHSFTAWNPSTTEVDAGIYFVDSISGNNPQVNYFIFGTSITINSVDTSTDTITIDNSEDRFSAGTRVFFETTGTLPDPLLSGIINVYIVDTLGGTSSSQTLTLFESDGITPVDLTTTGSGTHSIIPISGVANAKAELNVPKVQASTRVDLVKIEDNKII